MEDVSGPSDYGPIFLSLSAMSPISMSHHLPQSAHNEVTPSLVTSGQCKTGDQGGVLKRNQPHRQEFGSHPLAAPRTVLGFQ